MSANLVFFFMTMCMEPGVPQSVYDRYYKLRYISQKVEHVERPYEEEESETNDDQEDIEGSISGPQNRKQKNPESEEE